MQPASEPRHWVPLPWAIPSSLCTPTRPAILSVSVRTGSSPHLMMLLIAFVGGMSGPMSRTDDQVVDNAHSVLWEVSEAVVRNIYVGRIPGGHRCRESKRPGESAPVRD